MTDADNELARARLLKRLGELLDELQITGSVRQEMLAEPERAVPVLEHARDAYGVRNPAAFAISLWRQRNVIHLTDGTAVRFEPEPDAPPDLAAIEQVWALDTEALRSGLLKVMAAALTRHGGIAAALTRHRSSFK